MGSSWRDRRIKSDSGSMGPWESIPSLWQRRSRRHTKSSLRLGEAGDSPPPEFYDRLSKVELTHRSSEELDRRTRAAQRSTPARDSRLVPHTATRPKDLAHFSRHGGPDLRNLRGYHPLSTDDRRSPAISASRSSRSRRTNSTLPTTTLTTSATETKTRESSLYNRNFDLHLADHKIHATYASQKPDLTQVRAASAVPRPSLSPSTFSNGAFKAFRKSDRRATDEDGLAQRHRDKFIEDANAKARYAGITVQEDVEATSEIQHDEDMVDEPAAYSSTNC